MNNKLKGKIIEKYGKQWMFAKEIGVDETFVSRVITGARDLPLDKQSQWADKLNCNVKEIFPQG